MILFLTLIFRPNMSRSYLYHIMRLRSKETAFLNKGNFK